jgi:hypothetical protein
MAASKISGLPKDAPRRNALASPWRLFKRDGHFCVNPPYRATMIAHAGPSVVPNVLLLRLSLNFLMSFLEFFVRRILDVGHFIVGALQGQDQL